MRYFGFGEGTEPQLCAGKRQDICDKGVPDMRNTSLLFHSGARLLITLDVGGIMLLLLFSMTSQERRAPSCSYAFRKRPHVECTACFMKSSFISLFCEYIWKC